MLFGQCHLADINPHLNLRYPSPQKSGDKNMTLKPGENSGENGGIYAEVGPHGGVSQHARSFAAWQALRKMLRKEINAGFNTIRT